MPVGKIYRWLDSGWRPTIVRLTDIALLVIYLQSAFYIFAWGFLPRLVVLHERLSNALLYNASPNALLNNASPNTLLYNASPSALLNNASPNANHMLNSSLVNASVSIGTYHQGIFTNLSTHEGILVSGTFKSVPLQEQALALILNTLWFHWEEILVIWFFFEVLRLGWKASSRLVINFEDLEAGGKSDESVSDESEPRKSGEVLADLLVVYLNRINELYRAVDERRAIPSASGPGRPVDANIKAEESDILPEKEAGTFELWKIKIPTNLIMKLFMRLMSGPRLTVVVRKKENGKRYLTANMVGRRGSHSWIVDSSRSLEEDPDRDEKACDLENMLKELAYRIHASLAFGEEERVIKWRARYKFGEGLRAYRDALVSTKDRYYNLKKAEEMLIQAIGEDNEFALAYYNLGVVYTELGQMEAAESAFSRAVDRDYKMNEAYYALAMNLYTGAESCEKDICRINEAVTEDKRDEDEEEAGSDRSSCKVVANSEVNKATNQEQESKIKKEIVGEDWGCRDFFRFYDEVPLHPRRSLAAQYDEIVRICDHVVELVKAEESREYEKLAKAYNLRGNAERHRAAILKREDPQKMENPVDLLEVSIEDNRKAVSYSWIELLQSAILEDDLVGERNLIRECSTDLAYVYLYKFNKNRDDISNYAYESAKKAKKTIQEAISVVPGDGALHLFLGRIHCCLKDLDKGIRELELAIGIQPNNSEIWAHLALAYACWATFVVKDTEHKRKLVLYGPEGYPKAVCTGPGYYLDIKKKAALACNQVHLHGPGAYSEALEVAAMAYTILKMKNSARRLRRAAFLLDLKGYLEGVGFRLKRRKGTQLYCLDDNQLQFYIKHLLEECKDSLEECKDSEKKYEDMYWKYANLALADKRLAQCLRKDVEESEEYIQDAIKKLCSVCRLDDSTSTKRDVCKLLECQDKFALGSLLFEAKDPKKCSKTLTSEEIFKDILEKIETKKKDYNKWYYDSEHIKLPRQRYDVYLIEYSRILEQMGHLYLKHDNLKKADMCFQQAISLLELDFSDEIKRMDLNVLRADALRKAMHPYQSLREARKAQNLDPLDQEVCKSTGEAYCSLKDYNTAIDTFKVAYSVNPDNPDILMEIGLLYLHKGRESHEDKERMTSFDEALRYFKQAWKLYDRDDLRKRSEARYAKARTYLEMGREREREADGETDRGIGRYEKAISHLTVIYNAGFRDNSERNRDPRWLLPALCLGYSHLKIGAHNEAERLFYDTLKGVKFSVKQGGFLKETIKYGRVESLRLGDIKLLAHIGLAFSYANRNADLALALRSVEEAEETFERECEEDFGKADRTPGMSWETVENLERALNESINDAYLEAVRWSGGGEREITCGNIYPSWETRDGATVEGAKEFLRFIEDKLKYLSELTRFPENPNEKDLKDWLENSKKTLQWLRKRTENKEAEGLLSSSEIRRASTEIRSAEGKINQSIERILKPGHLFPSEVKSITITALEGIKKGEEVAKRLKASVRIYKLVESENLDSACLAAIKGCKGWVLYKKALHDPNARIVEAVELLEDSLTLKAEARTYLHLALAYEFKAKSKGTDKDTWTERAKAYLKNAEDLDFRKEYTDELKALRERLYAKPQAKEEEPKAIVKLDGTLGGTVSYVDSKKENK